MKGDILLSINREGSFEVTVDQEHANQCGKVGILRYRFFVSIQASNKHLTPEGFVMENLWVEEYFRKTYEEDKEPCVPCETMAQRAIEHFRKKFAEHPDLQKVDLRRIYVRIHGSDVSFIEGVWEKKGAKGRTELE